MTCDICEHGEHGCAGPCVCRVDAIGIRRHERDGYCPHPAGPRFGTAHRPAHWPPRGLGDTLARATTALGIPPCGGCGERQELLNRLVPY